MSPPPLHKILRAGFKIVANQSRYQDKWITDVAVMKAVQQALDGTESSGVTVDKGQLSRAVSKEYGSGEFGFDAANTSNVFRWIHNKIWYYYFASSDAKRLKELPVPTKAWEATVTLNEQGLSRSSRSRNREGNDAEGGDTNEGGDEGDDGDADPADDTTESPPKRQRLPAFVTPAHLRNASFLDSPEAFYLFEPCDENDLSVEDCLRNRIEKLQLVNSTVKGWIFVIEGNDPDQLCSQHDIVCIRQRCLLLCRAKKRCSSSHSNTELS